MSTTDNVELYIEELVLHGFPPGDRYRLGEAVERELVRLLTEQGVASGLTHVGDIARLDGGAFAVQPGAGAEGIGVQVAQSIYQSFNQ